MVVYLGRVVELADSSVICDKPRHPYTQALISAVPIPDPRVERQRERLRLPGELPSLLDTGAALRFLPSKLQSVRCALSASSSTSRCRALRSRARFARNDTGAALAPALFLQYLAFVPCTRGRIVYI